MSGGPVQLMAFGYGSATGAEDRIMAELDALQGRGVLRLLDFLFVQKTTSGELIMLDVGDDEDYGTILAGFFPWEDEPAQPDVDPDELMELADSLEPGTAMALVLIEHRWAGGLFSAVEAFGGELLTEGFITEEGELIVGAENAAIDEAVANIERIQQVEAAARLQALQSLGESAHTIEAARAIRSAAAAEALDALVAAGIIEEAATHEAADALVAAGIVSDEAARAAEEAVAEAAVAASAADEAAAERVAAANAEASAAELEAIEAEQEAIDATDAVERAEAEALNRAVVEGEIARDAARAEAERVAEAAAVQEAAAIDEANEVSAQAVEREAEAIAEAEAVETHAVRAEMIASITAQEKRVLRYLGTDLTFAIIADKLKITRGQLKTRIASIYRKLGVHSREDAVTAARELGLVKA